MLPKKLVKPHYIRIGLQGNHFFYRRISALYLISQIRYVDTQRQIHRLQFRFIALGEGVEEGAELHGGFVDLGGEYEKSLSGFVEGVGEGAEELLCGDFVMLLVRLELALAADQSGSVAVGVYAEKV